MEWIVLLIVLITSYTDAKERKIPNEVVVIGLLAGLLYRLFSPSHDVLDGLLGMGLCMLMLFPLYALGGLGAGDVKLSGTFGMLLGFVSGFQALLLGAIFGGLFAVVLLIFKGKLGLVFQSIYWTLLRTIGLRSREELAFGKGGSLAYGWFLGLGALVTVYFPRMIL